MLSQVLSEMLDELKSYRERHSNETRSIEQRLNCLEFDLKWLIKSLQESDHKKVA